MDENQHDVNCSAPAAQNPEVNKSVPSAAEGSEALAIQDGAVHIAGALNAQQASAPADSAMPMPSVPGAVAGAVSAMPTPAQVCARFSTWADKPRNNAILSVLFAAIIAVFTFANIFPQSYDNDIWFILATGEYIVENGIPYTNPFSLHEDMAIVVQQWLHCIIAYLIYSHFGFVGLGFGVVFLFAVLAFSLYKVGRIIRDDSFGSEWILLLMLPVIYTMSPYLTVRPHLYTMIAFTWIVGCLTLYRHTSKIVYLIPLPFISLLQANLHSSMAVFDLVIIVCFLIPDFMKPLHRRSWLKSIQLVDSSYPRMPLLAVLVICALTLLVNPYFIDGALYVVKSFGAASYANYIAEMNALTPARHPLYAIAAAILIATAIVVGRMGPKRINFPFALLVLGCGILSFTQVRNIWLCSIFCFFYIIWVSAGHSIRILSDWKGRIPVSAAICAVAAVLSVILCIVNIPQLEKRPENNAYTPVAAMDYLDEIGADKDKTRILNFFNMGGYIEYRGYRTVIDPRPELWSPSITGSSTDYYKEFVDMSNGETYVDDYIEKYNLNVYIVPKEDAAVDMLKNQEIYLEISGGDGYRAFILRSAYEEITGKDISTAPDAVRHSSTKN